jgi:ribose transport system permease protein
MIVTQGTPLSLFTLPVSFKFIGQGALWGVPFVILLFFVLVALFDFLLRKATLFRKVFYTGSNERAAAYSGININRIKLWVTVLTSTLAGLAGIIYMARLGSATPTFGVGMELNVIAAAVIGGASLKGGTGSILGAVLGVALLSIVTSSLILINVSVYWQELIKGLILLAAVSIDHLLNKYRAA